MAKTNPYNLYVPLIVSFLLGIGVSRLMNNQDIITGDTKEGAAGFSVPNIDWSKAAAIAVPVGGFLVLLVLTVKYRKKSSGSSTSDGAHHA